MAIIWTLIERRNPRTGQIDTPVEPSWWNMAHTLSARWAGLSHQQDLRGIDGLLMRWDEPGRHPIWMEGMKFPLNLIWIDGEGRFLAVLPNVPPCRLEPCAFYDPDGTASSVAVLELPAGVAVTRRLTTGSRLRLSGGEKQAR